MTTGEQRQQWQLSTSGNDTRCCICNVPIRAIMHRNQSKTALQAAMATPPAGEALAAEDALALVVANAAAMCALGAASAEEVQRLAHADEASTCAAAKVAARSAAELRSLAASSLLAAEAAGAAARGRARLAPVCRRTRAAADATSSPVKRVAEHARARAFATIHASLARDDAALCGGARELARLCDAASPPALPFWADTPQPSGGVVDSATAAAAAWRHFAREVDAAAPAEEEERDGAAGTSAEEVRSALAARLNVFIDLRPGETFPSRTKQLGLIGATAQEVAAGKALCAPGAAEAAG
jgi:hypothetical protein